MAEHSEGTRRASRRRGSSLRLVTECDLDGTCHGWDGESQFRLSNGEVWRQTDARSRRAHLCCPAVRVWRLGERHWIEFEGVAELLPVALQAVPHGATQ